MRKKYGLTLAVTLALVAALLLPACAGPAEEITLKLAYDMAPTASIAVGSEYFAEEVEKATDGQVKFDIYPSGTLFSIHETPDSLIARVADIANFSASVSMKLFPLYQIAMYPGLGIPSGSIENLEAAGDAHLKLIEKFPKLEAEFDNWKVLWNSILGGYLLVSKTEVRVPDDLKGLKVGGTGVKGKLVEACGGTPIAVPPPECYMNMKTGVVDAVWVNWTQVFDYKMWEVADYFVDTEIGGQTAMLIAMNWDSWNELPSNVQKVMTELSPKGRYRCSQGTIEVSAAGKKGTQDAGRTIYPLTAEEEALWKDKSEPLWYQWVDSMNEQGVDGQAMLDYWQELRAPYIQ